MTIVSSNGDNVIKEAPLKRRLLSTGVVQPKASGIEDFKQAVAGIQQRPISSNLPAIRFGINKPAAMAAIYGIGGNDMSSLTNVGFQLEIDKSLISGAVTMDTLRVASAGVYSKNMARICPKCLQLHSVFQNIRPMGAMNTARRELKQSGTPNSEVYQVEFSLLAVFNGSVTDSVFAATEIITDVFKEAGMNVKINSVETYSADGELSPTQFVLTQQTTVVPAVPVVVTTNTVANKPRENHTIITTTDDIVATPYIALAVTGAVIIMLISIWFCTRGRSTFVAHSRTYSHVPVQYAVRKTDVYSTPAHKSVFTLEHSRDFAAPSPHNQQSVAHLQPPVPRSVPHVVYHGVA
jgi:hypothetical protein